MLEKGNSIKKKIIYFLMIIIPLSAVTYFYIWRNAVERKTAEIKKNLVITQSAAKAIDHEIQERTVYVDNLSKCSDLKGLDEKKLHQCLRIFKTDEHETLLITDLEGKVLRYSQSKELPPVTRIPKDSYFKAAANGKTVVTPMVKSVFSGEYVIKIFLPVYDDKRKVIAVVGNELPVSFFTEFLHSIKIGASGHLALIDSNGNYIYYALNETSKKLSPARCFWDGKGQETTVTERKSLRTGQKTVYTKVRLQNIGWYVVASQKSSEIAAAGMATLVKDIITLMFVVATFLLLWGYKAMIENRERLIGEQNADKLALIGELAAGMAHEIRNPLTAIKGFSDLLRQKLTKDNYKETLSLIRDSVDQIEGIIRETLLLAKPQTRKVTTVDLKNLVEDTCRFMKNEAILNDIDLRCDGVKSDLFTKGDRHHLKQVLINLIKNALEATRKGGAISISLEQKPCNIAAISVTDTGPGIKAGDMDKVGRPFFTTKSNGTGLGLSVCGRIITEHEGSMQIDSTFGRGTTVTVFLPLAFEKI